jgi:steroid 5-alpha reductase family enzyme
MKFLLALVPLLFFPFPIIAATQEQTANAPVQTVDTVYVLIFLVGFIAAIVAFFVYYFKEDPQDKKKN